jgi:hypothetical protein
MKNFPLLLIVSLVGNLALVALVITTPADTRRPNSQTSSAASAAAAAAGQSSAAKAAALADTKGIDPKTWSSLAGEDFSTLVARLRAAGFPPSLVRAIVRAQVTESFAARRKALLPPKGDTPFWKADQPADPKTLAALRALSLEQSKLMKDLMGGPMPDDDAAYAASLRRQYGGLPDEKVDQITRVKRDYEELRSEVYTAAGMGGGPMNMTAEDRAKLALLEKEQRADIAQLLSSKELEDYELHTSNTANQMRYQLSAFAPNEEEFRTIYKLQSAFDEKYNLQNLMATQGTPAAPDLMRQRVEAQKQLTDEVKAALGTERGADYERAIDGNFQQISRVVDRLELPKEAAVQVWEVQKDAEQRLRAIALDRTLLPAARTEQFAALAQEANAKVTAALGQRGVDVYQQYGGNWLQNLQSRAASPDRGPTVDRERGRVIFAPSSP